MAAYAVAAGERGVWAKTLTAATVDTITFAGDKSRVEVVNEGPGGLSFTVDGSTPTHAGNAAFYVPAGMVRDVQSPEGGGTVVKVISSGTPVYSVSGE